MKDIVSKIKMILMDVDGVLTSGEIIYGAENLEIKKFHIIDGMGITLAKAAGLKTGVITGRTSEAVGRRAAELGFDICLQNCPDKLEGYTAIKQKFNLQDFQMAYIGDDIQDLPVLARAGLPLGVRNSVREVREICGYVASASGGNGAIREIIDWILDLQNKKRDAVERVLAETKNPNPILPDRI